MAVKLFLALALTAACVSARSFIIVAPTLVVAGNEETFLVINQGDTELKGEVTLQNNPNLHVDRSYPRQQVTLQPGQVKLLKFKLLDMFTTHIDVTATLNGQQTTKTLRVSQRTGQIFLHTDKPVYSPKESNVFVRFIATDENLKPANRTYRLQIRNPDNVLAMARDFHDENKSMFSFNFTLPEDPILGPWTVSVLYGEQFKQNESVSFQIEEYVLPTFTVTVEMDETLLPTMKSVPVRVRATHVYGKPVVGQVMLKEFLKAAVGDLEQRASTGNLTKLDAKGEAEFLIDLVKYQHDGAWRPTVKSKRLYIEAEVTERESGKRAKGFTDRAVFEHGLYKISIKHMQSEIRPGYPALITVRVRHHNGRSANDIDVELRALDDSERRITGIQGSVTRTDERGVASFLVPTQRDYTQIRFTVFAGTPPSHTITSAVLKAYTGKQFIALKKTLLTKKFGVGKTFTTELAFEPPNAFSGAIVAIMTAGKIMDYKTLGKPSAQKPRVAIDFQIRPEMSPRSRIVALAWDGKGQIYVDNFIFTIERDCRNADYTFSSNIGSHPGNAGTIELTGEPGTTIGIMGVDEAVYAIRKGELLTLEKIFSRLENSDRGCDDGGGSDLEESVASAGIAVFSDEKQISDSKNCHTQLLHRRIKRNADLQRRTNDTLAMKCCDLAYTNYLSESSCSERSLMLISAFKVGSKAKEKCQQHFLDCCMRPPNAYLITAYGPSRMNTVAKVDDLDYRGRLGDGVVEDSIPSEKVRKDFREAFMYRDITLGAKGAAGFRVTLPHSITTWSIQTVSVNPLGGVCSKEPFSLPVVENFFMQVDLPYKVVKYEHVEIKVTLYNYWNESIRGDLYIYGVEGVCTQARPGERSNRNSFHIAANSAEKITFPVFSLKEGFFPLKFEAISESGQDAVEKELYVVPEGREVRHSYSVPIDPTNTQRRKARSIECGPSCHSRIDQETRNQTIIIETPLPPDVVDGTPQVTLSVIGEKLGPALDTTLNDIDSLVSLPKGCGEQNMMRLAPLVFTVEYMKTIGKLEPLAESKYKQHIMDAYARQMNFQKLDGSFSAFRNRGSSLWLTAFVAKTFCRAASLFNDPQTFPLAASHALHWLSIKQLDDGGFREEKPILHKNLLGGVKGQLALTAFVTTAYDECAVPLNDQYLNGYFATMSKAKRYLMKNTGATRDGYTAALLAYSLSNTNYSAEALKQMRALMETDLESNTLSLKGGDRSPWVIEGTAYALLAATKARDGLLSSQIFYWLVTKQSSTGGFQSTQDTVVALQAMCAYVTANPQPPVDLSLRVSDGGGEDKLIRVQRDSASILQKLSTTLNEKLQVHASGHGSGLLSVLFKYNTLIPPEEKCPFNITVKAVETDLFDAYNASVYNGELIEDENEAVKVVSQLLSNHSRIRRSVSADQLVYELNICVNLLSEHPTDMSVIQVNMITGYVPLDDDLKSLTKSIHIERYELFPDKVNLYIKEFEPKKKKCVSFRVVQKFTVSNPQSAAVSVFDYYSGDGNCPVFYQLSSAARVLVNCDRDTNKMCKCLQNSCPPIVPFNRTTQIELSQTRSGRAVAEKIICSHDFVVEGKILETKVDQRTRFSKMHVTAVWKEASPMVGKVITLMGKEYCDTILTTNVEYMIFGDEPVPHQTKDGSVEKSFKLNENSRIFTKRDKIDSDIRGNFEYVRINGVKCGHSKARL